MFGLDAAANSATNKGSNNATGASTMVLRSRVAARPKIGRVIELVFELPYCRIENVVERGIAKRQTASVYLKELVRIGVLEEKTAGREKLFINPRLMKLLTRESSEFSGYR